MMQPIILDFDGSTGSIDSAVRIPLQDWQERIRFGCTMATYQSLKDHLNTYLPESYSTVLMGSGDYHHLSFYLIKRYQLQQPLQVVVFDNHPDNMRFLFGIHCGSWIRKVAMLPHVSRVHVVGITSSDISIKSALENYWQPLWRGKLTYWCMDVNVSWASWVGMKKAFRRFNNPDELIKSLCHELSDQATYLSIDKDVLAPHVVQTNWDQGRMEVNHILSVIKALSGKIIGSDITGDVSAWKYKTWWKKTLSALDGQQDISPEQLAYWQLQQQQVNTVLLSALHEHSR